MTTSTFMTFSALILSATIPQFTDIDVLKYQSFAAQILTLFGFSCLYSHLIFVSFYILTLLCLRYRYKKINDILETEFSAELINFKDTSRKSPEFNREKILKLLKNLSKLHLNAHQTISSINQIFSIPIMISFGFNVSSSVFSLYELISVLIIPNATIQQIGFCLMVNSWLPNALLTTILEVSSCMFTANEGNRTAKILRTFLCKEEDEKIRKKLHLFLLQIVHSRPSFSCGLFVFDWKSLGVVSFSDEN